VVAMALTGNGQPDQIPGQMISGNLLHMLGVNTVAGRPISAVDDQPASPAVALLGYGLWQRRFGGAESVIGQTITLDRQTYTVIGVLPERFELLQQTPDFVVAMGPWASKLPDDRSWHPGINAIARLKPGVSLSQARADMSTIAKRLYAEHSADNIAIDAVVNPMQEQLVGDLKPALTMLMGAVIFVLLIAKGCCFR
jgi:putative ABC transport system permease protein